MALFAQGSKRIAVFASQTRCYSAPATRAIPPAKQKYVPTSGSYPKGFLVGTAHAGVKESNTQYDDVALVISEQPCAGTAVFTRNAFQAAPIHASKMIMADARDKGEGLRGVVVNSGSANAITGKTGLEDATKMAVTVDTACGDETKTQPRTLVMSTGVIGKPLPMQKIVPAIQGAHAALGSTHDDWMKAANAICTTDTFPKLISKTFTLPSHPETTYSIAGMTKGAGMIHPNMGTLLGIVCTDAKIESASMYRLLSRTNNLSFNCISIDGDTSTNDTVAFFANGAAAPADVDPMSIPANLGPSVKLTDDQKVFLAMFKDLMVDLAKLVVRDGEGATKFITVRVRSARGYSAAKRVAESIATSPLVKTAMYGKDANWGRILCAIGNSPGVMRQPHLDPQGNKSDSKDTPPLVKMFRTSVAFIPADGSEALKVVERGQPLEVDEARAKEILEMEDVEIFVDLDHDTRFPDAKSHEVTCWTCDFSHEYVTINGDYRT